MVLAASLILVGECNIRFCDVVCHQLLTRIRVVLPRLRLPGPLYFGLGRILPLPNLWVINTSSVPRRSDVDRGGVWLIKDRPSLEPLRASTLSPDNTSLCTIERLLYYI